MAKAPKFTIRFPGNAPIATTYLNPTPGAAFNVYSVKQAASFASVAEARTAARGRNIRRGEIVQVEEVEGTPTYREVSLTSTVSGDEFALRYLGSKGHPDRLAPRYFTGGTSVGKLTEAKRFATVSDAIHGRAVSAFELARARYGGSPENLYDLVGIRRETLVTLKETVVGQVTEFQEFTVPNSSAVAFLRYDHEAKVAQVGLKRDVRVDPPKTLLGGDISVRMAAGAVETYEYANVDAADIFAFLAAPSKGKHFNNVWKPKYGSLNTRKVS